MRIRKVRFTPEFLTMMFRDDQHYDIIEGRLPKDSEIIAIYPEFTTMNIQRNVFVAIVRSDEFEDISEGGSIPEHSHIFRKNLDCFIKQNLEEKSNGN